MGVPTTLIRYTRLGNHSSVWSEANGVPQVVQVATVDNRPCVPVIQGHNDAEPLSPDRPFLRMRRCASGSLAQASE